MRLGAAQAIYILPTSALAARMSAARRRFARDFGALSTRLVEISLELAQPTLFPLDPA